MANVLIAGRSGLLGQQFDTVLRGQGHRVHGTPGDWWRGDWPFQQKFDVVIHAAGYAQPAKFLGDPGNTLAINTAGLDALLMALRPGGKMLFVSSSEVYSGAIGPHHEGDVGTAHPSHPRASYIFGKLAGEVLCHTARAAGADVKIARLALAYGPGVKADDSRVMSDFIRQGLTKGRITLRDSGKALRTYIYMADAVEMMLNVLLHGKCGTYNIGADGKDNANVPLSIASLAQVIGAKLNVPVGSPDGDQIGGDAPASVVLDISRYEAEFGRPKFTPFHIGLDRTIAWMRSVL